MRHETLDMRYETDLRKDWNFSFKIGKTIYLSLSQTRLLNYILNLILISTYEKSVSCLTSHISCLKSRVSHLMS